MILPGSVMGDALPEDETVAIAGFGTFSDRDRATRRGRNPHTGQTVAIAASRTPAFEAGKISRQGRNRMTA